jgi:hypothetical protein
MEEPSQSTNRMIAMSNDETRAREDFLSQLRRVNGERYEAWVTTTEPLLLCAHCGRVDSDACAAGSTHCNAPFDYQPHEFTKPHPYLTREVRADAGIMFDALELGGEVNVVKKLEREERGWRGSRAEPQDFDDEIGDVLICLDKLARRRGVDLAAATIAKFNATSEKVGLPHRLAFANPPAADVSDVAGLREAAQRVLDGLHFRIDAASASGAPVPVFDGIAALHDALAHNPAPEQFDHIGGAFAGEGSPFGGPTPAAVSAGEGMREALAAIINRQVCCFADDYDQSREEMITEILNALARDAAGVDGVASERWRHVKRGTVYEVIGRGELQMSLDALVDGSSMVVYRGDDGRIWVREESEFEDGRFEKLAAAPIAQPAEEEA